MGERDLLLEIQTLEKQREGIIVRLSKERAALLSQVDEIDVALRRLGPSGNADALFNKFGSITARTIAVIREHPGLTAKELRRRTGINAGSLFVVARQGRCRREKSPEHGRWVYLPKVKS